MLWSYFDHCSLKLRNLRLTPSDLSNAIPSTLGFTLHVWDIKAEFIHLYITLSRYPFLGQWRTARSRQERRKALHDLFTENQLTSDDAGWIQPWWLWPFSGGRVVRDGQFLAHSRKSILWPQNDIPLNGFRLNCKLFSWSLLRSLVFVSSILSEDDH